MWARIVTALEKSELLSLEALQGLRPVDGAGRYKITGCADEGRDVSLGRGLGPRRERRCRNDTANLNDVYR